MDWWGAAAGVGGNVRGGYAKGDMGKEWMPATLMYVKGSDLGHDRRGMGRCRAGGSAYVDAHGAAGARLPCVACMAAMVDCVPNVRGAVLVVLWYCRHPRKQQEQEEGDSLPSSSGNVVRLERGGR